MIEILQWQSVALFVGGMLSTTAGVAWGTQKWKSKIENAVDKVGGRVTVLENERLGARPYCRVQRDEIIKQTHEDIKAIVAKSLADEQIRYLKAREAKEKERQEEAIKLALVVKQNETILDKLEELKIDHRQHGGSYSDRTKQVRAQDHINPRTGDVL